MKIEKGVFPGCPELVSALAVNEASRKTYVGSNPTPGVLENLNELDS